jgi:ankyrin repeat domain-containing protein 54
MSISFCAGSNPRADIHNRCKAERVYKNQSRHARHALIERLVKPIFFISDERNLRRAVSTNNTQTVAVLLNSGVSPNAADEFKRAPLHLAACRGYIQILQYVAIIILVMKLTRELFGRLLLAKGANPNQKDAMGNTALHLAACTNNVPVVTLLLKAGMCLYYSYRRKHLG